MIALVLVLAAAAWMQAPVEVGGPAVEVGSTPGLVLEPRPSGVAIGQPVEWILRVPHAPRERVRLATEPPLIESLEASWAVVAGPDERRGRGDGDEAWTEFVWTLLALEGGERTLPAPAVAFEDGRVVSASVASLRVAGALADGEDAPRALPDFHDIEPRPRLSIRPAIAVPLVAALLALGALGFLVRRRQREGEHQPTAIDRFLQLSSQRAELADDASAIRELVRELTLLVRGTVDARAGVQCAGLSDQEWLAQQGASEGELAQFLTAAEGVKYAGGRPTPFAIAELFESARSLLEDLADEHQEHAA